VNRLKLREVTMCQLKNASRIAYQLPRDGVTQPPAAELVASQSLCPRGQLLHIGATNPTVRPDRAKREVAPFAEIHHVLPRRSQQLRGIARRDQVIGRALKNIRRRRHTNIVSAKHKEHHGRSCHLHSIEQAVWRVASVPPEASKPAETTMSAANEYVRDCVPGARRVRTS
jgi:hypothetical protein